MTHPLSTAPSTDSPSRRRGRGVYSGTPTTTKPETSPMPEQKRRHITYDAPVVPIRYPVDDKPVTPCHHCLPWSVDFTIDDDGNGWVTEWHAAECEWVEWWLSDDDLEEPTTDGP